MDIFNTVCRDIPDGYVLTIGLERGSASIEIIDPKDYFDKIEIQENLNCRKTHHPLQLDGFLRNFPYIFGAGIRVKSIKQKRVTGMISTQPYLQRCAPRTRTSEAVISIPCE